LSNVPNNCKWCEGEISQTISMCSGCQILLTPSRNQIQVNQGDQANE
jgi:hypothetical protein